MLQTSGSGGKMASTIKVDDNKNYGSIDPISKKDPSKPKGKFYCANRMKQLLLACNYAQRQL